MRRRRQAPGMTRPEPERLTREVLSNRHAPVQHRQERQRRPPSPSQPARIGTDQRLRCSGPMWSPPPESNRRPHPYHGTTGNRCADARFCRSCRTVGAEVIGSPSAKLCAHLKSRADRRGAAIPVRSRAQPNLAIHHNPACWLEDASAVLGVTRVVGPEGHRNPVSQVHPAALPPVLGASQVRCSGTRTSTTDLETTSRVRVTATPAHQHCRRCH
jgi:hypothetical protein